MPRVSKASQIRELLDGEQEYTRKQIAKLIGTSTAYVAYVARMQRKGRGIGKRGNPHRAAKTVSQSEACARYLEVLASIESPYDAGYLRYLASEIRKGMWKPYIWKI